MRGALPRIADLARRLQIQATIGKQCPSRSNAHLTRAQVGRVPRAERLTPPER